MYYHSNQQALKKLKILLKNFRFSQILRRGGNSANVMQSQRYETAGAKHTFYRPGVRKLWSASRNRAAREGLQFLNRMRLAKVSHVFLRCLIKSMSQIERFV